MKQGQSAEDKQTSTLLQELQHYMLTGLNYAQEKVGDNEQQSTSDATSKTKATVHSIRRITGEFLPFSFNETTMEIQEGDKHWISTTECMRRLLYHSVAFGADGLYGSQVLATPEARHAFFKKSSRDCEAVVESLGWDIARDRLFLVLANLEKPSNGKELLMLNFKDLMFTAPSGSVTPEAMEGLYEQLMQGIDISTSDDLGDSALEEQRRANLLKALCEYIIQEARFTHPLVKAITAYLFITLLKPFPLANLPMARLVYTWVCFEQGLSLLSALPIVEFESNWRKGVVAKGEYKPRIDYLDAIVSCNYTQDWTCHYEEILGFLFHELQGFRNKLIRLHLRRKRLYSIMREDASINARQVDILVEALVHEDAEFFYAHHMEHYGVGYATAYEDLANLKKRGFLLEKRKGKQAFFCANEDIRRLIHEHLSSAVPEVYARYYDKHGNLLASQAEAQGKILPNGEVSFGKRILVEYAAPSFEPDRAMILKDEFSY